MFLSTHLLAEVEQLCTRVGVLDRGRLVVQDQLDALRAADRAPARPHARTSAQARGPARRPGRAASTRDELLVRHDDPAGLNRLLVEGGVRVELLAPERRTLEDVVLEATRSGSDRVAR